MSLCIASRGMGVCRRTPLPDSGLCFRCSAVLEGPPLDQGRHHLPDVGHAASRSLHCLRAALELCVGGSIAAPATLGPESQ